VRELEGAGVSPSLLACEKVADCDGSSLALRSSGLRRRRRKWFKLPGRLWVLLFETHNFVLVAGRFMGAGSDRGDVQSDSRHLVPES
jgi:hypothetical protein